MEGSANSPRVQLSTQKNALSEADHDFFAVKGVIASIVELLKPGTVLNVKPFANKLFTAGRGAELWIGNERLGFMGEVSKAGQAHFELRGSATVAELRIGVLDEIAELIPIARELSSIPPMARELLPAVPVL